MAGSPVRIIVSSGRYVYLDTGSTASVAMGDTVVATAATAGRSRFGKNVDIQVLSSSGNLVQDIELHTSCSEPLNLGDRFGAVQVAGLVTTNGGSVADGATIRFDYELKNASNRSVTGVATDDQIGPIFDGVLGAGETWRASRTRMVVPDQSNGAVSTVLFKARLQDAGASCEARDSVKVSRISPAVCSDAGSAAIGSASKWNGWLSAFHRAGRKFWAGIERSNQELSDTCSDVPPTNDDDDERDDDGRREDDQDKAPPGDDDDDDDGSDDDDDDDRSNNWRSWLGSI
jgi:hypothetical protein